jgi:phage tail-like protein
MANEPAPYYPPVGFSFVVNITDIDGQYESNVQEVSGLNAKMNVEEVKEGGENRFVHRLPSPPKYENLILKRGMVTNSGLIDWARKAVEQFLFSTKTVVISLLDGDANHLATWNFVNAYPVSIKISDFKAQENAIVVETLELCYDYFQRIK